MNPTKSKSIVITRKRLNIAIFLNIIINGCIVEFLDKVRNFGLRFNRYLTWTDHITGKTKSMSIVNSSTTRLPRPNAIVLNGHPVEEVNQFTYLGNEICKDGGSDAEVD